jgi:hypothetical protein
MIYVPQRRSSAVHAVQNHDNTRLCSADLGLDKTIDTYDERLESGVLPQDPTKNETIDEVSEGLLARAQSQSQGMCSQ